MMGMIIDRMREREGRREDSLWPTVPANRPDPHDALPDVYICGPYPTGKLAGLRAVALVSTGELIGVLGRDVDSDGS